MEPSCATEVADYQRDIKPDPATLFQLNYDETDTYMPSPFCNAELPVVQQQDVPASPSNNLGQTAIPTPPPERTYHSPDSTHSCISPQHSASATSDSYIKGSSLEESPVSSPSSSYAGEIHSPEMQDYMDSNAVAELPTMVKKERESCIREPSLAEHNKPVPKEGETSSAGANSASAAAQNVPKNIKLPQRKGGMQLWQFLYALLNDPDRRYRKLIEWTANNLSREFRLLEPEAIAIWWGEHKNKKNMSYDKLSRSLRYYYDKGIIRKISGERYVYQFCIDPELMYKHIGNSDSRPKLKPMPSSAYHATSEYQNEHGFAAAALMNKDPCFVAQGPMSLGLTHGHFGPRPAYPPPPGYNSPFLSHGYADFTADFHSHLGAYNNVFFPTAGYDAVTAVPHVGASLGYAQMDPPIPFKAHLPPLRKSQSYEMPNLTAVTQLKYDSELSYAKPISNTILNSTAQLKYGDVAESFCGKSPMLHSNSSPQNIVLSSHTLSPPPLTRNKVSSPVTPSYPSHGSPLSRSCSPHTYSGHGTDPLAFDDLMPFSSTDDYSSNTMTYHLAFSKSSSTHSQVTSTSTLAAPWDELQ